MTQVRIPSPPMKLASARPLQCSQYKTVRSPSPPAYADAQNYAMAMLRLRSAPAYYKNCNPGQADPLMQGHQDTKMGQLPNNTCHPFDSDEQVSVIIGTMLTAHC
jgi:hypothetical protein